MIIFTQKNAFSNLYFIIFRRYFYFIIDFGDEHLKIIASKKNSHRQEFVCFSFVFRSVGRLSPAFSHVLSYLSRMNNAFSVFTKYCFRESITICAVFIVFK